jgi:hypothetical protein
VPGFVNYKKGCESDAKTPNKPFAHFRFYSKISGISPTPDKMIPVPGNSNRKYKEFE